MRLSYSKAMRNLPPPWGEDLVPAIREAFSRAGATLIVMDDAPTGRRFMVISRSDSTLRGHFRAEIETLTVEFEWEKAVKLCIPAFFEGGRFTIEDVHYVKEGD